MNESVTLPSAPPLSSGLRNARRFWPILLLATLAGVAAGIAAWTKRTVLYEGEARLLVSPARFGEGQQAVSTGSYAVLLRSRAIAAALITEFKLGDPPESLTPERFVDDRLGVTEVRGTSLLGLRVRMQRPDLAAEIANAYAAKAVALNRELNQRETVATRDMVKAQLDEATARLDTARRALLDARQRLQVELLERDSEALLAERRKLVALEVDIAGREARAAQLAQQLASTPPRISLNRSIDANPAALEAVRQSKPDRSILDYQLRDEAMNPVYSQIEEELAATTSALAGLRSSRDRMVGELRLKADRFGKLDELYRGQTTLERLKTELEVASKNYTDLSAQYELARLQVASRSAELQVVDRATPPDGPVSVPSMVLIFGFAAAGALAGAILVAVSVWVTRAG